MSTTNCPVCMRNVTIIETWEHYTVDYMAYKHATPNINGYYVGSRLLYRYRCNYCGWEAPVLSTDGDKK
jgi:hypothetical protein